MRRESGMALIEMAATMAIMATVLSVGALYLKPMAAPLQTAADSLEGTLRGARAKGMATTSAYRVRPLGSQRILAETAARCSSTLWTTDPVLDTELPEGVTMTSSSWSVCFSGRGTSSDNLTIDLWHADHGSRQVEVMLGGTTRVLR